MKILIAYDGTPGARAVFRDLRLAALPDDTQAHVVAAATEGSVPSTRALFGEEARLLAEAGAAHVRTDFPTWTVTSEVVSGAPAEAILRAAARWRADLIVVGTRGLAPDERAVLGSVAREVITTADVSVRVARPVRNRSHESCRLLVGFDGSKGAQDAVAEVCRRHWPEGTEVRALAARPPVSQANGAPSDGSAAQDGPRLQEALARVTEEFAKAGLATSTTVRVGEGREALLDEARVWDPDAIFVGGRRLQRLRRFIFGSVAGSVADDAPCSVEVVRPAADG